MSVPKVPNPLEDVSHEELVARALRWVKGRTTIAVSEPVATHATESPDVIGWTMNGFSWLVECKRTRADFRRDASKPARQHATLSMGTHRYYFCPAGLLQPEDIPDGWGLVWSYPNGRGYLIRECTPNRSAQRTFRELPVALSLLRRALDTIADAEAQGYTVQDRLVSSLPEEGTVKNNHE